MHVTQLRSMPACPQHHLHWTEPWITSASNNLLPKFSTKTTIPIASTGSRKMVWRGGHAPHIVHWWHPNSPKPELCTSHQPILPLPNFTSKNKPQQIVQVVKWEATENQLEAHSQTATTKSLKQVHNRYVLQQSPSKRLPKQPQKLLFQKSKTNLQVRLVSPPNPNLN